MTVEIPDHLAAEFIEAVDNVKAKEDELGLDDKRARQAFEGAVWNLKAIATRISERMVDSIT